MAEPPKKPAPNTGIRTHPNRTPAAPPSPKGSTRVTVTRSMAPPKPTLPKGSGKETRHPTQIEIIGNITRHGQAKLKDITRRADPNPTHKRKT